MNTLSPREATIWKLFQEGKKLKEIATLLNISIGSVSARLSRIRIKLQIQ